ncbi:MAG: SAM-dependent methyltransferase, partial [Acidobacteriota bacterium]|nr:SAM-dependent methyltransferase [Acidobacteriota bacterium]
KPNGIFIFDCWYGPAVLSDPPVMRVKRLEDEKIEITRIAEPEMYPNENRVDVHYQVFIKDKSTERVEILKETHRMRYLFKPEIEQMLELSGLSLINGQEWLSGNELDFSTWNGCFIAEVNQ